MNRIIFILFLSLFAGCSHYEMRSDLTSIVSEQREAQKMPASSRFEIWQYRTTEKIDAEITVCVSPLGFHAPSSKSFESWMCDSYKRESNSDRAGARFYEIRFTISR